MIDLQPKHVSVADLLERRLFSIPEYQRSYSWTSRQRTDLFGDIQSAYSKGDDVSHFMATIVCLKKDTVEIRSRNFDKLDVVDGQQRLTTIVMLLNAIRLALDTSDDDEKGVQRDLSDLLVKPAGGDLLLLQTNHDDSHFFSDYIRHGSSADPSEATTVADRELLNAISECRQFVDGWRQEGRPLTRLVSLINNRLTLILYEISEEREVYTVFEVLNSRGLRVAWLDRLKAILMGAAFELEDGADPRRLIDDLHVEWRDIYRTARLRQGLSTEALRFAATLWDEGGAKPLGEEASVDLLRQWAGGADDIREVARWLRRVTEACREVVSDRRLNAVTRIGQARLLAVAIHLMEVDSEDRDDLLRCWECVSFRIFGMFNKDARTRVGDFVRLARRVISGASKGEVRDGIVEIGARFDINGAVDELRDANCYEGWEEELRYVMFRYEEHLAREQGNNFENEQWAEVWAESASRSIEHIWAQSVADDDYRHRLGNLILLPPRLNSKLRDKPFSEKRDAYREVGLLTAGEVARRKKWTKKAIRKRERKILEWALTEWADP